MSRNDTLSLKRSWNCQWLRHFQRSFESSAGQAQPEEQTKSRTGLFYGFDLAESESDTMGKGRQSLVGLGLFRLWAAETSTSTIYAFLEVSIPGINIADARMARFKIYYRSRQTSFDSVVANLALGGLSKLPPSALADLKHLWHLILDTLDVEYDSNTCTPLPAIDHETAGMLYDAAIRLGDPVPVTKVYIPVRHYGRQSDGAVMDGLVEWLRESGSDVFGGDYVAAMSSVFDAKSLRDGLGIQTYLGVQVNMDGSLRIVSYLNPQLSKMQC